MTTLLNKFIDNHQSQKIKIHSFRILNDDKIHITSYRFFDKIYESITDIEELENSDFEYEEFTNSLKMKAIDKKKYGDIYKILLIAKNF